MKKVLLYTSFVAALVLGAARLLDPDGCKDYVRYLSGHEPAVELSFDAISQYWDEQALRQAYPGLYFDCNDEPSAQRSCYADIRSYNGLPAMGLVFFLADKKVQRATVYVPSWYHGRMLKSLIRQVGAPSAIQSEARVGPPLVGWRLADGAGLFANRDTSLNPLARNAILWIAPRVCATGCWSGKP